VYDRTGVERHFDAFAGSFIALASIIVGSMAAMKYQMWRLESRRWHWLRPSHWRRSSGATRRL
jgi:hypothetical protein